MDYSWAVPGAKCVCIDDRPVYDAVLFKTHKPLQLRRVYTVRQCSHDMARNPITGQIGRSLCVHLVEFERPCGIGFGVWRFAPLVARSQEHDVALFKRIAADAPADLEPAL